ncbi:Trigger factor [uncultured Roseburia sp.]|uniref:Trigger factor n=1 Tax=Brotonthovivens ammoniilytica TaxID=2981725 RepID=A0ABT2TKH8_9FIRM|nr:trigger factor [Brotonthovivens ammoniilytica]MCU6762715.1 trigger factor [Brotonthovivens ammoniilytica]SCI85818.1 Trigger factor [uncultured Roseburia sp.]
MILGPYTHLTVKRPDTAVSETEINQALKKIQTDMSVLITIDTRPARIGDQVIIQYQGYLDSTPIPNTGRSHHPLILGSGSFLPEFEEQLTGRWAGDKFSFPVYFSKDYPNTAAAGKEVVFQIHLLSVGELVLQDLDDDFAKDFSDFDTLAQLRDSICQNLTEKKNEKAQEEICTNLLTQIIEHSSLDPNPELLAQLKDEFLEEFQEQLARQGLDTEQFLSRTGHSDEFIDRHCQKQAERKMQETMVLHEIARTEQITFTDDELEEAIYDLAEEYEEEPIEFLQMLSQDEIDGLKLEILCNKALNFVMKSADFIR